MLELDGMFKNASSAKVVKMQRGRLMAGAAKKGGKCGGKRDAKRAMKGKTQRKRRKERNNRQRCRKTCEMLIKDEQKPVRKEMMRT